MTSRCDRILALVARPALGSDGLDRLASSLTGFDGWETLVRRAEAHGLAPLLHSHLREAGVTLPGASATQLIGLVAYHRRVSLAQGRALGEALDKLDAAGIRPLVLKGASLARTVYPDPALRPMGDLDLLLPPDTIGDAVSALGRCGFAEPPQPHSRLAPKHRVLTRTSNGVAVNVELHFRFGSPVAGTRPDSRDEWSQLNDTARTIDVLGRAGAALGPTECLRHLAHHVAAHADVFTPLRLIWMCDIVGWAEMFGDKIDWMSLRRESPEVIAVLGLLDQVIPFADPVRRIFVSGLTRSGDWDDYHGFPRAAVAGRRPKDVARVVRDTLWPNEWWLRLHRGLDRDAPILIHRMWHHPREMLVWYIESRKTRNSSVQ
jgi:hypothetical protein